MTALRQVDPEWSTQAGDHTADSHAPEVFSIETDTAPDAIIDTPIPLILSAAQEAGGRVDFFDRSEEHTSELQSLMRISYAVFCLKKKITQMTITYHKAQTPFHY